MSDSRLLPPFIHPSTHWPNPSLFVGHGVQSCRLQQTFWVHSKHIGRAGPLGPGQCPNKGETSFFKAKPTPGFTLTASAHCFSVPTQQIIPVSLTVGRSAKTITCGGQRILLKNLTNVSYLHNPVKRNLCKKWYCIWYMKCSFLCLEINAAKGTHLLFNYFKNTIGGPAGESVVPTCHGCGFDP